MAGVLVDVLIERLATLALDKIERELKLVAGVKQEIKNLTKKLQSIQAVLEDAEQRQVTEANVKLWLSELNDVSFDMDDVLDEWITKVLIHQHEKEEREGARGKFLKKVHFPSFGQVNYKLFLRGRIAKKIEELNERLALIDQNKQNFNFQNNQRVGLDLSQSRKTTSLPNPKTFGRDNEKELIITKLLSEGSDGNVIPLIIPIVGLGGIGKTSLANLVYNDDLIKSHFDKSIWVCVSDPFEEIKIARAIVEALDKTNPLKNSDVLDALLKEISRLIKEKRFLLVLDDVWSPESNQWEELLKPLCDGAIGSRVLVTTRNEKVATLMKATTQMIRVKELNESFCLSLFFYNASMDEGSVSREYFDIGLKLVRKCNGLPLAAKSLGSLMSTKKTIREWQEVLDSKMWELEGIQGGVFRPLMLSFQNLDLPIKRCLLYCVLFPKDHMYDKTSLIELWMSQDYLNAQGSEKSLTIGQNYFDELAKLSFFQDLEVDNSDNSLWFVQPKIRFKIHDIVHDFLQYLTKNEYLVLGDGETEVRQSGEARHLSIAFRNDIKPLVSILSNCKKLRSCSLNVSTEEEDNSSIRPILELIQGVRTLSLFRYKRKRIPETMSRLIHLRYLHLSDNKVLEELPRDVMGGLYNLQTLRLVDCYKLKKVYVGGLVNLKHLYVQGCEPFLEGVEKLTRLQTLDEFTVSDDGNKLEHLRDLNQLQGSLFIAISKLENNTTKIMVNKAHLLDLNLLFDVITKEPVATYEDTMESLEPHPNLERLFLSGYKGNRFSNWLSSLHSLTSLRLHDCEVREISPLGKLKSLERLEMRWLDGLERMGVEFLGIEETSLSSNFISFPKLTHLRMDCLWRLQIWEGVKEEDNYNKFTIMPSLTHLEIMVCESLEALPDFLWETPLQQLAIVKCPSLEELYMEEDGEQWSKISHIPNIHID